MDDVLTLVDVAKHLKVPISTARKLVVSGTVRGFKIGNRWRVLRLELDAYIAHQQARSSQPKGRPKPHALRSLPGWKTFQ